jgi:hypothetical protein
MSGIDWKPVSESAIALGAFLAYVLLALEIVLHYADLKRRIMKPNFQFQMYVKGSSATIAITNAKEIGNCFSKRAPSSFLLIWDLS